jgi:hypothetical protein
MFSFLSRNKVKLHGYGLVVVGTFYELSVAYQGFLSWVATVARVYGVQQGRK